MKKTVTFTALAYWLCSCGTTTQPDQTSPHCMNAGFAASIRTVGAVYASQVNEITFAGRIVCDPDRTVSYSPLVNGVVERIYFSLGDHVVKGQPMMDLRSTELSALEAELGSLEAELLVAQRELESAGGLLADALLSEREYLQSQGRVNQARAALKKVKANLAINGNSLGDGLFSVVAPVSGYVIERKVAAGGTFFADSQPLFAIADLQQVWVETNIYASNLQFVCQGMTAEISSVSYPNELFYGKVNSVSNVFDPEDKALKARIALPNDGMKLKPEMSVSVKLRKHSDAQTVALPSEAVIFDHDSYHVVIRRSDGRFEIRAVSILGSHGNITNIASGVEPHEEVVVKNQLLIYNELKVGGDA